MQREEISSTKIFLVYVMKLDCLESSFPLALLISWSKKSFKYIYIIQNICHRSSFKNSYSIFTFGLVKTGFLNEKITCFKPLFKPLRSIFIHEEQRGHHWGDHCFEDDLIKHYFLHMIIRLIVYTLSSHFIS